MCSGLYLGALIWLHLRVVKVKPGFTGRNGLSGFCLGIHDRGANLSACEYCVLLGVFLYFRHL